MGEYYDWINIDKKQYICPNDFDLGNKCLESSWKGNPLLRALRELLSDEWKDCRIIFMGDDKEVSADVTNSALRYIYEQTVQYGDPGMAYDMQIDTYRNLSGLFKGTEENVLREIRFYLNDLENHDPDALNEYGIDIDDPFNGLFLREGKDFKYTLNHTKKLGYSPEKVLVTMRHGEEFPNMDPLPLLLGHGFFFEDSPWLGDIIGVSDELPEGYTEITEFHFDY